MVAPSRRSGNTVISTPPLGAGGKPLRDAAETIAAKAREISGQWSARVPASIRVTVTSDGNTATIIAGGPAAPQAYTMEGRANGKPIAHPVFGHGTRIRGPLIRDPRTKRLRHEPPGWTWAKQTPRPFLQEAADSAIDAAADKWGKEVIEAWSRSSGFR